MTDYGLLLADLVQAGRDSVSSGLVIASGGNLSVRGPGSGQITVTCSGSRLDSLGPETLTVMSLDGGVVSGRPPSSEWQLHQQIYLARPDADAIVHLHPEFTVLLDAVGEPIRQLTLDHIAYAARIERIPFFANASTELAVAGGEAIRHSDCVVMAHHGCVTVGPTPFAALRKATNVESAARATYRMLMLGDRTTAFPAEWRGRATHE